MRNTNTNTKRTIWSSLVIATTALFVTSCGFDRLGDDFDVNQDEEINYANYVEMISARFSIKTENEGFGLVGQNISCDQVSLKAYNSDTGFDDTYPSPTYETEDVIVLANKAGGSLNVVKGDRIDIRLEKIRCATGAAGANEIYFHPAILKDAGGANMVEKTTVEKGQAPALPAANSLNNTYSVAMQMAGVAGKTITFKYSQTCAELGGCTTDNVNLTFSASGFKVGADANTAVATYGSTVNFTVGGVPAPEYTFKGIKHKSTDGTLGWIKFAVAFECTLVDATAAGASTSGRVNPTSAELLEGGPPRDPQCAGTSHIGKKVVWINHNDGGWSDVNIPITEAQAIAAINANAGKAITVAAADLVQGGQSPQGRPVSPADTTGIVETLTADKDGFAVNDVQTADSFYSSGLKKNLCVYAESGADKGINCTLIEFNAFPSGP